MRLIDIQLLQVDYVDHVDHELDSDHVQCAKCSHDRSIDFFFFLDYELKDIFNKIIVKMGLAGPKIKQRIPADPRNLTWSNGNDNLSVILI